ncbi:hypothetical protein TI39_contig4227g00006 [Zymoseptoria brevis]|uniref:Uncharacterized protein n=1 Tax=Zymoseptoria brevis TaxID=1047168 RepID=A0A0F4G9I0_9PEZI|nr:hypothetical protein TI39_contig4227g00006 [Zymoseptoria brevis]
MQPTLARMTGGGYLGKDGRSGVTPWRQPVTYETFRSKYGPQYKIPYTFYGITTQHILRVGQLAGGFGLAAGIFAIYFFDGIPKVQRDILDKVPFIRSFYNKEIPPEDNPF